MRQVMRKGLITVAAATGVLTATGGYAHADAHTSGASAGSPGVASGNSVQVPIDIPVNVCGNTVNVLGAGNAAAGNTCGGGAGGGGSSAGGHSAGSGGVGSGNSVQVPIDIPVNVCGNSVNVGALGSLAVGNDCAGENGPDEPSTPPTSPESPPPPTSPENPPPPDEPSHPGTPNPPAAPHEPAAPVHHAPHGGAEQLAETGGSLPLGATLTLGTGALLAGAVLYRKARAVV